MYDYFFTVRSITTAQRGAKLLEQAGIFSQITRTPKSISEKGCGYRLMVHAGDQERAAALLRDNDLHYSAGYRVGADGEWEADAL
jgi:predicted RNA polymerase sigma factor